MAQDAVIHLHDGNRRLVQSMVGHCEMWGRSGPAQTVGIKFSLSVYLGQAMRPYQLELYGKGERSNELSPPF